MSQEQFMQQALEEARKAFDQGEIPIGAILACKDQVIARAHNTREQDKSPLSHAEIKVLQDGAKQKGDWRLNDCDLYVTLEPCPMCLGALFQARVGRLFVGALDQKRNETSGDSTSPDFPGLSSFFKLSSEVGPYFKLSSNNHNLHVYFPILEKKCADILKDFFQGRRPYRMSN